MKHKTISIYEDRMWMEKNSRFFYFDIVLNIPAWRGPLTAVLESFMDAKIYPHLQRIILAMIGSHIAREKNEFLLKYRRLMKEFFHGSPSRKETKKTKTSSFRVEYQFLYWPFVYDFPSLAFFMVNARCSNQMCCRNWNWSRFFGSYKTRLSCDIFSEMLWKKGTRHTTRRKMTP